MCGRDSQKHALFQNLRQATLLKQNCAGERGLSLDQSRQECLCAEKLRNKPEVVAKDGKRLKGFVWYLASLR